MPDSTERLISPEKMDEACDHYRNVLTDRARTALNEVVQNSLGTDYSLGLDGGHQEANSALIGVFLHGNRLDYVDRAANSVLSFEDLHGEKYDPESHGGRKTAEPLNIFDDVYDYYKIKAIEKEEDNIKDELSEAAVSMKTTLESSGFATIGWLAKDCLKSSNDWLSVLMKDPDEAIQTADKPLLQNKEVRHAVKSALGFVLAQLALVDDLAFQPESRIDLSKRSLELLGLDLDLEVIQDYRDDPEKYIKNKWTEEDVVREKEPREDPSKELKYSINTICYNEMPIEQIISSRGNLADHINSILGAVERYAEQGREAGAIEVLLNINNRPGVQEEGEQGTVSNRRALELVDKLRQTSTYSGDINDLINEMAWISKDSSDRIRQYYELMFERAKKLFNQGFQLHAIDCTDGMYITRESKDEVPMLEPTQGARRRLLGVIAQRRLREALSYRMNEKGDYSEFDEEIPPMMITLDADTIMYRDYFTQLEEMLRKIRDYSNEDNLVLRMIPRFVVDQDNGEYRGDMERSKYFAYYHDLSGGLMGIADKQEVENSLGMQTKRHKAIFSTFACSLYTFEKAGGWDIRKNFGEDADMFERMRGAASAWYFLNRPLISIKDRIRAGSWWGNIEHRTKEPLGNISFTQYWADSLSNLVDNGFLPGSFREVGPGDFPELLLRHMRDEFLEERKSDINDSERELLETFTTSISGLQRTIRPSYGSNSTNWLYALTTLVRAIESNMERYPNLAQFLELIGRALTSNYFKVARAGKVQELKFS